MGHQTVQAAEDIRPVGAPTNSRGRGGPRGLSLQVLLYALMCSVWGASFFFTAIALRSFNAVTVPILRMTLATLALAAVVRIKRLPLPNHPRIWMHVAILGALNIAVPYILLNQAQRHVDSSLASVLSATTPLFAFLFSWLVVRTERFNLLRAAGLIIAFAGIAMLYGFEHGSGGDIGAWALIIVLSSAMFAAGNVYTRRFLGTVHPFVVAFLQVGTGAVYLLVAGVLSGTLWIGVPSLASILAVLELGLAGSALTYVLFFHFIQRWGSTATSLNTYFQPLVGITLGLLVLGERVNASAWAALALVLCGVIVFGVGSILSMRRLVCAGPIAVHPSAEH